MEVSKEFRFDAAHRLMFHPGKCRNIHGHTYRLRVSIVGKINEETGMVIDFGQLSTIIKPFVDDILDHSIILNIQDKDLINLAMRNGFRTVIIRGEPTAENIAVFIADHITNRILDLEQNAYDFQRLKVKVWETPTSVATFERDLTNIMREEK